MACRCYLRCIEKSFNYSGGDIYIGHRLFLPLPFAFACEVKGKGPNPEGKRGLTGLL
jgi:hypothetical protein